MAHRDLVESELARDFREADFVGRVPPAVHEDDGQGINSRLPDLLEGTARCGFVERD